MPDKPQRILFATGPRHFQRFQEPVQLVLALLAGRMAAQKIRNLPVELADPGLQVCRVAFRHPGIVNAAACPLPGLICTVSQAGVQETRALLLAFDQPEAGAKFTHDRGVWRLRNEA